MQAGFAHLILYRGPVLRQGRAAGFFPRKRTLGGLWREGGREIEAALPASLHPSIPPYPPLPPQGVQMLEPAQLSLSPWWELTSNNLAFQTGKFTEG